MSSKRYPKEFKVEAVKQVADRGHPAAEVASRLGVSLPTLYEWLKRYGRHGGQSQASGSALRRGWSASEKTKAEEDSCVGSSPARAPFGRQSGLVDGFRV